MIEDIVKSEGIPGYILSAFFFKSDVFEFFNYFKEFMSIFYQHTKIS